MSESFRCSLLSFGQYIYKIWFEIVYRQIVDSPMGTNYAPLVADLFRLAMREASCCLFLTIIKLMLMEH